MIAEDADHDVITAVATLTLAEQATIEDVQSVIAEEDEERLNAHLTVLKTAPLAFIALLDEVSRIKFVAHVRNKFLGAA